MSTTSRPKYDVVSPANSGEPTVAREDKAEGEGRKHFHRKGKKPSGRSGKGYVRTPHHRGGRRD